MEHFAVLACHYYFSSVIEKPVKLMRNPEDRSGPLVTCTGNTNGQDRSSGFLIGLSKNTC